MTGISTEGGAAFNGANPFTPIGTVLGEGSSSLRMTTREEQVATMLAFGFNYKRIGHQLGISTANVGKHVAAIAKRIPGQGNPRQKVACWMYCYATSQHATSP